MITKDLFLFSKYIGKDIKMSHARKTVDLTGQKNQASEEGR
jgi:hypothetical protein